MAAQDEERHDRNARVQAAFIVAGCVFCLLGMCAMIGHILVGGL